MTISIIVAKATNNAIGLNGDLPWHLPSDLKHFKKQTAGHHVIMGRRTYQSLEKPLPGRTHIIVSENRDFKIPEGHFLAHSLEEALEISKSKAIEKVYILGGARVYKAFLPFADEMIITEIEASPEADTFFPDFDPDQWKVVDKKTVPKDEKNEYNHSFVTYVRKK